MTKTIYIWALILIVACQSREKKQQESFAPQYIIKSYYDNSNDYKNLKAIKYYDLSNRLLRETGKEGDCTRYLYDETGKLIEKVWVRSCEQGQGVRSIFIYDSSGNHVGIYMTLDTLVNLDTVEYEQTYFYDNENRLVKEKVAERVEPLNDTVETWNYYSYDGDKKDSVIVKENDILLWKGDYKYDMNGRLVELRKTRRNTYENEYFIYDDLGRLIEKQTKTNGNVVTPMGIVEIPDTKRVYTYDSTGFQNKEILCHDGKAIVQIINIKE